MSTMSAPLTVTVTDDNFAELVLGADLPVLLEFWASWCGPCRMLGPVLAEIAAERAGQLTVAVIDTEVNPVTTARSGVLAMPTLHLYRNGELVRQTVGALPKRRLLREIDEGLRVA